MVDSSFDGEADAVDRGLRGNVQALVIGVAKSAVAGSLGDVDGVDRLTFRRIDDQIAGGDVQSALLIDAEAIRRTVDLRD
jgi:hypothetical protein